jgi:hypothetical protein
MVSRRKRHTRGGSAGAGGALYRRSKARNQWFMLDLGAKTAAPPKRRHLYLDLAGVPSNLNGYQMLHASVVSQALPQAFASSRTRKI